MSEIEIRQRIIPALALLLDSSRYARAASRSVWDFAVEIDHFRFAGVTNSDLRFVVSVGYAEHASEVTQRRSRKRVFRKVHNLAFNGQTCFVLTESGETFARNAGLGAADRSPQDPCEHSGNGDSNRAHLSSLPRWLRDRRELRVGDRIVKQFRVPAPNQETILAAFEEEGWPYRIDDPLPPQLDQEPKRRLHDAINKLNRHQRHQVVQFRGDGTGRGVCWELTSCSSPNFNSTVSGPALVAIAR